MFIDSAVIFCKGGRGGNGCNSFERGKNLKHRRPNGGDGGNGGSVILMAQKQVHTLLDLQMRKTFRAPDGKHGGRAQMAGADAPNEKIPVPCGTEIYEDRRGLFLKDLCEENDEVLVARGGAGGKGNHRRAEATRGQDGEVRTIRLELKLIADVGLVGFPNSGKSTFISHVSNAKSKIAPYPFTTKEPVLGVVKREDDAMVLADIPGLVQGAHEGRGLGHKFLKHVERTKIFLQLVDMAGADGRDPVSDYHVVGEELAKFSPVFANKFRVVAANKMDIPEAVSNLVKFKRAVPDDVFEISAATGKGLPKLVSFLFKKLRGA